MKTFKSFKANLEEKKLTPAEMKKREEVAKAIERENPNMPMGMKMAIATKTAKRVAEEEELDEAAWGKDKAANLKNALNRHTEKAIAANKAGDHEAVKVHQSKMNMIKNQMSKLVKEEKLDELKQMTLQRYASKAYRVGMQGGPKSAKHLAGAQRAKEKLKYGDYSEEVEQVDEVSKKTAVSYIQKKVSQIAKRPGEAMLYTTKMTGSDYENLKRAYKRAGVKEEVEIFEGYSEDDIANGGTVIYKHQGKHYMSKVSHKTGGGAGTKIHTTSSLGHVVPLHNVVSTDASDWTRFKNATVKEEVKDEYARKVDKYLKKKYNKEEFELDEATQFPSKEHAISYAKEKVKTHKDSDDGIEVYSMPGGGARVVHTMNSQGRQQVLKGGGKKVTTVTREEVELDEAGPFSYGAKPPKKGTVAYNAMMKRKEQDNKPPIEPKDQMVGIAKKLQKEEVEDQHYCAKHVYSNVYGEGVVLEGQHADPDENGNIEWYVVNFAEGPKKVYTEKLDIMIAEYHGNHKKKRMTNG